MNDDVDDDIGEDDYDGDDEEEEEEEEEGEPGCHLRCFSFLHFFSWSSLRPS